MTKKLKIYLDTSVINFLFADDAPEKKEITIDFFENYLNDYDVFISDIVIDEISKTTNEEKKLKLLNAIEHYNIRNFAEIVQDIYSLSEIYLNSLIIPKNKEEDALHLAFATYYEFDVLLSWNFKHLANIKKQEQVNIVNLESGYRKPLIMTNPMEVVYEK
jgi:predicted nucleic acid-binding protein